MFTRDELDSSQHEINIKRAYIDLSQHQITPKNERRISNSAAYAAELALTSDKIDQHLHKNSYDLDLSQHENIDDAQQLTMTGPVDIIPNTEQKESCEMLSESPIGVDEITILEKIDSYQRQRSSAKNNLSDDDSLDDSSHSKNSVLLSTPDPNITNYQFQHEAVRVELRHMNVMKDDININIYGSSKKGISSHDLMKPNQDSFFVQHCLKTNSLILACMDGHGSKGHFVSSFCNFYLKAQLHKHPDFDKDIKLAIKQVVAELDAALRIDELVDTLFSGTTLVIAVIRNDEITVANIGDSKAILGYRMKLTTDPNESNYGFIVQPLSASHKPDSPEEKSRITANGGRVMVVVDYQGIPCGPARVYLKRENIPGLAMSRSLGDDAVHDVGVSSEPTFETIKLKNLWDNGIPVGDDDNAPRFVLIVATDGLFDVLSNIDIMKVAHEFKYDPCKSVGILNQKSQAQWLKTFGLADDTTIICASI